MGEKRFIFRETEYRARRLVIIPGDIGGKRWWRGKFPGLLGR